MAFEVDLESIEMPKDLEVNAAPSKKFPFKAFEPMTRKLRYHSEEA